MAAPHITPAVLARRKPKVGRWRNDHKVMITVYLPNAQVDDLNERWLKSDAPFFSTWISQQLQSPPSVDVQDRA
jgi:hypothetical protein